MLPLKAPGGNFKHFRKVFPTILDSPGEKAIE